MREETVVAKSKNKEVGSTVIQVAETLAEAVQIAGSEAKLVELFNRQHKTDTRNSIARPSTGGIELKTKVELYHSMVENGVPEAQAKAIAKLTDEEIERVTAALAAKA